MGISWSAFVDLPLRYIFGLEQLQRPYIEYQPPVNLIAQAATLAAQQRRMSDSSNSSDSDSDQEMPPARSPPNRRDIDGPFGYVPGDCQPSISRLQHVCATTSQPLAGFSPISRQRTALQLGGRGYNTSVGRASMLDSFLPNRHKLVDATRIKTFCAHYFNDDDIMTASQDGVIRFYTRGCNYSKRYTEDSQLQVPVVGWSVLDVAISPDSQYLAYTTWRDIVFLTRMGMRSTKRYRMERELGKEISEPEPAFEQLKLTQDEDAERNNGFALFQLKFSPDGREVLAGSSAFRIFAVDLETKRVTLDLTAHEDDINTVAFSSQNHLVFSAGDDGLCKVWDRRAMGESDQPAGIFAGHRDGITSVDVREDDRYVVTNCKDQSIKIWDIRRFASDAAVEETTNCVRSQRWDYRFNQNPVYQSELLPGDCSLMTFYGHVVRHTLIRARFSPRSTGSRYVYTGCAAGKVWIFDILKGESVAVLQGHNAVVRECEWNGKTNEIASASWDGHTFSWKYDCRARDDYQPLAEDEESSNEFYESLKPQRKRTAVKRRRIRQADLYDSDMEM